ncbi:ArsC/Spx/MgsR family protein [Myxococcus xanthus]|uniref:ArsC/Spx/MgsR family protein n=1 Tax=Myxococcus xanthus TaxID=34 RepID=UPI00112ABD02|nr:ArsC/Spx/MgsR family protein [Myxococcus xanthus]QDF04602.1 arsenate reductase [Myxococcus xanthus]
MELWINPACSKCRAAMAALDASGAAYVVRRYLESPPTAAELEAVLGRLELEPWEMVRMGEAAATEATLEMLPRDATHRADWIAAMVQHPELIQRPIVTASDGTTVVGRSPEALERVLAAERGSGT